MYLKIQAQYRDNYIPKSELSVLVMQFEKYVYCLNSLNQNDEQKITKKSQENLPANLEIKIRNPKGRILLGRSYQFDEKQHTDFEFIKMKYSNIIDIFTHDSLLNRIDNIVGVMKNKRDRI